MDPEDRKFLQDNMIKLSENCNFWNVLEFLKVRQVFTQRQLEYYESENFQILGQEQKCQKLFTDLQTRGPNAFSCLQECFKVTGQHFLYELITRGRQRQMPEAVVPHLVVVKKSKVPHEGEDVYEMLSYPRGKFIFINNKIFDALPEREGAEWDEDLTDYLNDMGYEGNYHVNKKTQEMRTLLQDFAVDESLSQVDSCIIIIGSHGDVTDSQELYIHGCDFAPKNPLLCDEIIDLFHSDVCTLRQGCPKIFIFQACRGDGTAVNGKLQNVSEVKMTTKPWQDTFLLAPCIEGLKANRFEEAGTWLILALKDVLQNHAHNLDLGSMKNLITDKFDEFCDASFPHLPQTLAYYEYGISKKLYFNPGVYRR